MLPLLAATGDHSVVLELGDCENMILEEKGNKIGQGRGQVKRRRERTKKKTGEYREEQ